MKQWQLFFGANLLIFSGNSGALAQRPMDAYRSIGALLNPESALDGLPPENHKRRYHLMEPIGLILTHLR
jgi:hypothetical protein